ncbi:MAG: hypothetical protein H6Q13_2772 [Bacteroidetes bacterium]|nr:hypothetical protein [Bacteroidota bacterium]
MNTWLHRISHHAEVAYPLLDKNLLCIGFSEFINIDIIDSVLNAGNTWQERWPIFEKKCDSIWDKKEKTRHNLWRFIEGFKKGDVIIVPKSGTFSIYKIVGEKPLEIGNIVIANLQDCNGNSLSLQGGLYKTADGSIIDLGFVWEVEPIEINISRYEYADASLTARLKIRSTNALINDISDSINKAIDAFKKQKPINIRSTIIENLSPQILKLIRDVLNPDKLETLVKRYFESTGATAVDIPPKNQKYKEGDADVIAIFDSLKLIIYCQVKFHEGSTNSFAIDQISNYIKNKNRDMLEDGNEDNNDNYSRINWVISSADKFTDDAIDKAKKENVQLIGGLELAQMILNAGLSNLNI